MAQERVQPESVRGRAECVIPLLLAAITFAVHAATNHRYGFHHDELYFIACGRHFDFGYVDHAPLVPWIARLSVDLFGASLRGLRLFPALAGALTVFLTGLLAGRLGGGRFAQATAALAALIAPAYLRTGNMLTIPSFEPLYWALCSYLVVRIIQEDNPRLWLWVGLVAGAGLMNKHTMLLYGFGLTAGLALTPMRKHFKSPWLYAGGALALCLLLPNFVWQVNHDWATLRFIRALNRHTMAGISPVEFVLGQVLYMHPISVPLWAGGLVFFLFIQDGKPYRVLGWLYVAVFVALLVIKSKIYYLAPVYPVLFAGGGVLWESILRRKQWTWARPATFAVMTVGGLVFAPLALPIFSIEKTDRCVGVMTAGMFDNVYELTGDLHGQFGWPERVAGVAEVYHALPEQDRQRCAVVARDYGLAGAIDLFGPACGLPHAVSMDKTYHLWGVPDKSIDVVIAVGFPREELARFFNKVEKARMITIDKANPWERQTPVTVCRDPIAPVQELWSQIPLNLD